MKRVLLTCAKVLENHPGPTRIGTVASMMLAGDLTSQKIIEKKDSIDVQRASQFFLLGIGLQGPVIYVWYRNLERMVPSRSVGASLAKVFIDQAMFWPAYLPFFIGGLKVLQRRSWKEVKDSVKAKYVPVLTTSWTVWPAVQTVNFYFVSPKHRVLCVSCIAFMWNIYLSWKASSPA